MIYIIYSSIILEKYINTFSVIWSVKAVKMFSLYSYEYDLNRLEGNYIITLFIYILKSHKCCIWVCKIRSNTLIVTNREGELMN